MSPQWNKTDASFTQDHWLLHGCSAQLALGENTCLLAAAGIMEG